MNKTTAPYSAAISVFIHAALLLLLLSDFAPSACTSISRHKEQIQQPRIIHAKTIDAAFLDALEKRKQQEERRRMEKAREEHERIRREKAEHQAKMKAELEQRRKEKEAQEHKQLAEEEVRQRKRRERERKDEEKASREAKTRHDKVLAAEAERRREAEEKARQQRERREDEAKQKRLEQERKAKDKAKQARKRREAEAARRKEMAKKEAALARRARLKALWGERYAVNIHDHITSKWTRPPKSVRGGDCVVRLRQNRKGEILEIKLLDCDGDKLYIQSVENAVRKANPLPAPPVDEVFEPKVRITFKRDH